MINGDLAELKVAAYYCERGWSVFLPVVGNPECDMLIMKDRQVLRVEVKSTTVQTASGSWAVQLKRVRNRKSRKFDNACCDVLAIYIVPLDQVVTREAVDIKNVSRIDVGEWRN